MPPTLSPEVAQRVREAVAQLLADCPPTDADERAVDPLAIQALCLARQLQQRAIALQTPAERRQQAELDRLIQSPHDKATLMQMTDQAFRSRLPHRSADQLIHILDAQGIPRFFSAVDEALLRGFQSFGAYLPGVAMPFVKEKMQQETANVVLPAEEELLRKHLVQRRHEGVRMNVNLLGEALLGEREAQRRLEAYLHALARPEIEVISVKISTIYSQITPIAFQQTVDELADRLELLYRAAARNTFVRADGVETTKLVYLDMEEYRDKETTTAAFMQALDRPGLEQATGGIALQAYIPDSFATQRRITGWARRRVAAGGAPVTLRLVKGANMEMERVEASLHGWPAAPFADKRDTDANYARMLHYGMQDGNLQAVQLGIASHNLFTLAYGLVLAAAADALDRVQFEMLEGMANHQRRALFETTSNMLLYGPACRREDVTSAVSYLMRRLDENTGPDNFLRHAFRLQVDDPPWRRLEADFIESFDRLDTLPDASQRTQDRRRTAPRIPPFLSVADFVNEPDTDWSLPRHAAWATEIVDAWRGQCDDNAACIPLVVGGEVVTGARQERESIDPSRPHVVVARYREADEHDVVRAVATAQADVGGWRRRSVDARGCVLANAADTIAERRSDLLGAMLAEGGKLISEGDAEVSEAVDFCRFYAAAAHDFYKLPDLAPRGRGVAVVVSPWNFPLAIPCGGVAAALAAGNTVLLKPASDTVLVAWKLCQCFWDAGVPETALQCLPCPGAAVGQSLVSHQGVDTVILTGGTATAREMLRHKPSLRLLAETGGKNGTVVTALADRDLAIKNVVHSAFSHSGQKCSATSLLIVEQEVYEDRGFRETLCDAVESLTVDSAWNLATRVGPLIRPPRGDLERGLKELEPGESWAVMPRMHVGGNPHLVSPGVKWGVSPLSFTHRTELFGPLLGVMRARNLHEAIDLVNATGYGLASGLESLDDREHRLWQEGVRAGNLYINRPTTGAIVLRQPFGGMGHSCVGPGIKAGGPNYIAPLIDCSCESAVSTDASAGAWHVALERPSWPSFVELCTEVGDAQLGRAAASYAYWAEQEFLCTHDHLELVGEDNVRRYLPFQAIRIRVATGDTRFDLFARALAARSAGCRITISVAASLPEELLAAVGQLDALTDAWAGGIEFIEESDEQLAQAMLQGQTERVRYGSPDRVPRTIRAASAQSLQYVADARVCVQGRFELLWYFQEQSLSHRYHRYGNVGERCTEKLARV